MNSTQGEFFFGTGLRVATCLEFSMVITGRGLVRSDPSAAECDFAADRFGCARPLHREPARSPSTLARQRDLIRW